ncbi:dual specificity protein phosphatase 8-like protein [Lates japonicus]|uniref:protein-tyrosine-phosphatase n=1 Tax=Lates japonicus TaxID=270547 RepID=A0AAD3MX07_LATJO|nr:dual specificity protein phosphatase 8-like protein [Lates japonicus]
MLLLAQAAGPGSTWSPQHHVQLKDKELCSEAVRLQELKPAPTSMRSLSGDASARVDVRQDADWLQMTSPCSDLLPATPASCSGYTKRTSRAIFHRGTQNMVWSREREAERPPLSVILPRLYLGAESDVTQDQLASLGISYVLSVSRCSPQPSFLPRSRYLRIPIDDSLWDDLLPWIPQALHFIDTAMSSGASVLVHCAAGISRSPALAVAYIMYSLGMDLDHAYRFVKERRPSISPNFNFLGQLQHFQGTLSQKASGEQLLLPSTTDSKSHTYMSQKVDYDADGVSSDVAEVKQLPRTFARHGTEACSHWDSNTFTRKLGLHQLSVKAALGPRACRVQTELRLSSTPGLATARRTATVREA